MAKIETTAPVVTYKGKSYRQLWRGRTKYGERAHLAFLDGSKDFWVDAAAVSAGGAAPRPAVSRTSPRGRRTGCSCGSIEGEYHDWYCASCRFDEIDQ